MPTVQSLSIDRLYRGHETTGDKFTVPGRRFLAGGFTNALPIA
jgi:hypothetical protein